MGLVVFLKLLFFIFVQVTLAKYISDLLYRYECVIIPDFGGFISNAVPARVNHFTHTFYPPSKELSFNVHLTKNDGLLANYVAACEKLTYSEATAFIAENVALWKAALESDLLELDAIGVFSMNKEQKLVFEPNDTANYLTSSFGMSSFISPAVKRLEYKEKAAPVKTIPLYTEEVRTKRKTPVFLKYAATLALIFALGSVGWKEYQKFEYNKLVAQAEMQQERLNQSIQEATFVISNPLPAITLNVAKKTSNYHIIAGAFRDPSNADKKLKQLLDQGYKSRILGVNKWNLTQVAYESLDTRSEALQRLQHIKETASQDAWLLVKEY
jgi:hypothetical protein